MCWVLGVLGVLRWYCGSKNEPQRSVSGSDCKEWTSRYLVWWVFCFLLVGRLRSVESGVRCWRYEGMSHW